MLFMDGFFLTVLCCCCCCLIYLEIVAFDDLTAPQLAINEILMQQNHQTSGLHFEFDLDILQYDKPLKQ